MNTRYILAITVFIGALAVFAIAVLQPQTTPSVLSFNAMGAAFALIMSSSILMMGFMSLLNASPSMPSPQMPSDGDAISQYSPQRLKEVVTCADMQYTIEPGVTSGQIEVKFLTTLC